MSDDAKVEPYGDGWGYSFEADGKSLNVELAACGGTPAITIDDGGDPVPFDERLSAQLIEKLHELRRLARWET